MSRNILVVDDVDYTRRKLGEYLKKNHFNVIGEARTGREASDMYRKLNPDIVTMDLVMPDMGGLEAARKIIGEHPAARIVIITGVDFEHIANELIAVGVRDYLFKPIEEKHLIQSIETVMTSDLKLSEKLHGDKR